MIEWIKFKGSTNEENRNEVVFPCVVTGPEYTHIYKTEKSSQGVSFHHYTAWAPLNLPQKEEWERKYNFPMSCNNQNLLQTLNTEFDNIYSKLNELRKR